jgi:hypothetical protein
MSAKQKKLCSAGLLLEPSNLNGHPNPPSGSHSWELSFMPPSYKYDCFSCTRVFSVAAPSRNPGGFPFLPTWIPYGSSAPGGVSSLHMWISPMVGLCLHLPRTASPHCLVWSCLAAPVNFLSLPGKDPAQRHSVVFPPSPRRLLPSTYTRRLPSRSGEDTAFTVLLSSLDPTDMAKFVNDERGWQIGPACRSLIKWI